MTDQDQALPAEPSRDDQPSLADFLERIRFERWLMMIMLGAGIAVAYAIYREQKLRRLNGLGGLNGPALGYAPPPQLPSGQPINIYNNYGSPNSPLALPPGAQLAGTPTAVTGVAVSGPSAVDDTSAGASLATKLTTTTVSATGPTRIFQAVGGKFWRIQLRNVGPSGSFLFVATDPAMLINTGSVATDAYMIPVGGVVEFQLRPDQVIYGRGNVAGVVATLAASVERV